MTAPLDLGNAWQEAERVCRKHRAYGPALLRLLDGYAAEATMLDGRRYRVGLRAVNADPAAALEELAEKVEAAAE